MKSVPRFALLLCLAGAFSLPALVAQPASGPGRAVRNYDLSTETMVSGSIADIQHYQRGRAGSIHLVLKSDKGTIDVRVGPSAYVASQGFVFAKGDALQVFGSRVTIGTDSAIIAREITRDGKKLILRDATGRPLWARAARRVTG